MTKHTTSLTATFTSLSGFLLATAIGTGAPVNTAQAIEPGSCYNAKTAPDTGAITNIDKDLYRDLDAEGQAFVLFAARELDDKNQKRFVAISSSPDGSAANLFRYIKHDETDMICTQAEGEILYANSRHSFDLKADFGTRRREGLGDKQSPCDPAPGYFRESETINEPDEPENKDNNGLKLDSLRFMHASPCESLDTYLSEYSRFEEPSLQMAFGDGNEKLLTFNYGNATTLWTMLNTSPNGSTQRVTQDTLKNNSQVDMNYKVFQREP